MSEDVAGLLALVIAGVAAGIGLVSWWSAQRSARAADRSASAAAEAVTIGRRFAAAAQRSAAAAGRSSDPTSEARHAEEHLRWQLTPAPASGGGCQITARNIGGPAEMTVTVGYYGVLFGDVTNGKAPGKMVATTRMLRQPCTQQDPLKIPIACPEGWDHVAAMELHIALQSIEGHAVSDDVSGIPWFDLEHVTWERDPVDTSGD